jgi:ATP-binding cassette subfamily B protein
MDAAGRRILADLDLAIAPGEQVALVGRSGSGKSTLLGLLLGWSQPSRGRLVVDGVPLAPTQLAALRARTVWVDPTVQLWNRPLLANLAYGNETSLEGPGRDDRLVDVLAAAHLLDLVEALPEGIATPLGESGGLVSGGEGQRVRIGRAMLRADVGLVLLDEAFRGVPRDLRATLLAEARSRWPDATFLHVTHDLDDVARFDRVVVLEEGRVVFAGPPSAADDCPEYAALRDGQRALGTYLADRSWRRWRMEDGRLRTVAASDAGGRGRSGLDPGVRG